MTWLEFKNEVIEQASEVADQATAGALDGLWAQACAMYVRAEILRELHTDDGMIQTIRTYRKDYQKLRRRLLGYTPTHVDIAALGVAVRLHLTADGDRKGANTFIDSMIARANDDLTQFVDWVRRNIRQGALDLQDHIPAYRLPHETTYEYTHIVAEGNASKGRLPELGDPRQMWVIYTDPVTLECTRHELKFSPWVSRYPDMIETQECGPKFTISPNGDRFWITPALVDANWKLIVRWDGVKLSYEDSEDVPFGNESVAKAVANYVRAQIAKFDDDPQEFELFNGEYVQDRTRLYLRAKRRSEMNWGD